MRMFPRATIRDCKQYFENSELFQNSIWGSNVNYRKSIFDVSHAYVRKLCPKENSVFFLASVIFSDIDIDNLSFKNPNQDKIYKQLQPKSLDKLSFKNLSEDKILQATSSQSPWQFIVQEP